jgi:hypothetical protein
VVGNDGLRLLAAPKTENAKTDYSGFGLNGTTDAMSGTYGKSTKFNVITSNDIESAALHFRIAGCSW